MLHYLSQALWFNTGANIWQWITSVVAITGWGLWSHTRFTEDRCEYCYRKGVVPVTGSHHKHCKRHAVACETTHT